MPPAAIGTDLERRRLELRAERIRRVLRTLEVRHRSYAAAGLPRLPLQSAIRDFHTDLQAVQRALRQLPAPGAAGTAPARRETVS